MANKHALLSSFDLVNFGCVSQRLAQAPWQFYVPMTSMGGSRWGGQRRWVGGGTRLLKTALGLARVHVSLVRACGFEDKKINQMSQLRLIRTSVAKFSRASHPGSGACGPPTRPTRVLLATLLTRAFASPLLLCPPEWRPRTLRRIYTGSLLVVVAVLISSPCGRNIL